ncbi:hypothetical protein ACP4OV_025119 [Aristida adscensionis]
MLRAELQDEEEFQEADILWPDDAAQIIELPKVQVYYSHVDTDDGDEDEDEDEEEYSSHHRSPMTLLIREKASSPIDIPGRKVGAAGEKGARSTTAGFSKPPGGSRAGSGGGSVVVGSHVFVPPHVIVDRRARREKAMMMFVVPSGRARARARKMMRE